MLLSVCSRLLVLWVPNKPFRRGNESSRGLGRGFVNGAQHRARGTGSQELTLSLGTAAKGCREPLRWPARVGGSSPRSLGGCKWAAVSLLHGVRDFGVRAASAVAQKRSTSRSAFSVQKSHRKTDAPTKCEESRIGPGGRASTTRSHLRGEEGSPKGTAWAGPGLCPRQRDLADAEGGGLHRGPAKASPPAAEPSRGSVSAVCSVTIPTLLWRRRRRVRGCPAGSEAPRAENMEYRGPERTRALRRNEDRPVSPFLPKPLYLFSLPFQPLASLPAFGSFIYSASPNSPVWLFRWRGRYRPNPDKN